MGNRKERVHRERIARTVKRGVMAWIALLSAALLALLFQAGRDLWPFWLIAHRKQVEGLILFIMIVLILLSPILIEAASNPRRLSGPGRSPYSNRQDE